jgi:hypothetical protein
MSAISWDIDSSGGVWVRVQISDDYLAAKPWIVSGNMRAGADIGYHADFAWQVFYPTMKVVLRKQTNHYNPMIDMRDTPSAQPFPNTQVFVYDSSTSLIADIGGAWGRETRYIAADLSTSGVEYCSYVPVIQMEADKEYWIAVRGYSPSEQFQVMSRFYLPNRYDYGFERIADIISDISASTGLGLGPISRDYLTSLTQFNMDFSGSNPPIPVSVVNTLGNVGGVPFKQTFTGFADFYAQYVRLYTDYSGSTTLVNDITTGTAAKLQAYLELYYADIMPAYYFQRSKKLDPLRFSLLFKSSVHESLASAADNWGLGYNLGFYKKDYTGVGEDIIPSTCDSYSRQLVNGVPRYLLSDVSGGGSTVFTAPNFYRIFEDYIYLRMNKELGFNKVDSTSAENLKRVQDSTGETNYYHAKLLLGAFGDYSTSMIYNPVTLNPALSRLDRLSFQWVNSRGEVLSSNNAEWSAVVYITEIADQASLDSTWVSGRRGRV